DVIMVAEARLPGDAIPSVSDPPPPWLQLCHLDPPLRLMSVDEDHSDSDVRRNSACASARRPALGGPGWFGQRWLRCRAQRGLETRTASRAIGASPRPSVGGLGTRSARDTTRNASDLRLYRWAILGSNQ